ncbi:MAG: substrate-binding domain-containing protein [Bacteroidetes bacterium]|nr:substrate-binding domain-containing protein [Bacteroidota bacterium]
MNIYRKYFCLILFLLFQLVSGIANAEAGTAKSHFLIGFSQCTTADAWRRTMDQEMQNELIYYSGLDLIIRDAENSSLRQISDIRELISSGVDLLIVSPNESAPLTAVVSEAYKKGIPVIVIDRKIESGDYTAFIGANNYQIGREAGRYAVKLLQGRGRVFEIWGLKGSSPAKDRHNGFMDEISKYPDIKIVKSLTGEWDFSGGKSVMEEVMKSGEEFDLVFAHNDFMALGAYDSYINQKKVKRSFFIGVDGLPGANGGSQAVMDHKLDATLLYPTGGRFAISIAWDILNHKPYKKENELNTLVIDSTNVRALQYQSDEILDLHRRIVSSRQILDEQIKKFYSQRFWLLVAISSLFIVILLGFLLLRAYRNKAKANHKLELQKQEITSKNEELIRISKELEDATRAKLIFFTNISHEFRTPLTLIIGPLENMLMNASLTVDQRNQLDMMLRNANRLLRLINQLMDLRKIDDEKMKLNAGLFDIIAFTRDIREAFNEMAAQKNIEFTFQSQIKEQLIYFDKDKMDKILFNLLSNAFKFAPVSGSIEINVAKVNHVFSGLEKEAIEIQIKDNGPGIPEKHIERIFERFYQVEQEEGNVYPGTGIGLPLTKGFTELHKGDISVLSKPGIGTSFFVYFRLGREHLSDNDIIQHDNEYDHTDRSILSVPDEKETVENPEGISGSKGDIYTDKPLIMIIEDNADVAKFIKSCLSDEYRIMTASNGMEGFEKMYLDEPDLIICDVMMPVMDGLEFSRKLKSDIRTCHIPLILLTARSSHEQKIEGLETGADSYIAKPFNSKHLLVRVQRLIESRQKIRKHYQQDVLSQFVSESKISQLDSNFLKKCSAIIENHLTEPEYGVEQLGAEIGLSRVHVYRKIKHLTGLSVSEFIRNLRLKKAAALLTDSGLTVSEISYQTGFSSPSYFAKCFKDLYNLSPSEYLQVKGKSS